MKKVLLGLAVVSSMAMAGEGTNLYLKTGLDISGKFDKVESQGVTYNKAENDRLGFDLTAEVTREFYPNLELGLGLSYQDHGKPENISIEGEIIKNTGYKSLPIYAVAKYNIPLESNIKPYLKADLGYSFNFDEKDLKVDGQWSAKSSVDNGLYYGLGAGAEYNNFVVELMYKVNRADVQYDSPNGKTPKKDYDYSRTTLSVGYRFDI
ncbi:MAG: porin family protein [Fusobacterium mortiferum]